MWGMWLESSKTHPLAVAQALVHRRRQVRADLVVLAGDEQHRDLDLAAGGR